MIIGEYCDSYPPELDGVGMVVKNYVEELNRRDAPCYYVAPDSPGYPKDEALNTLLYGGVKFPGEPYRVGVPTVSLNFRRLQHAIDFDIVHAHSPFFAGLEALRLSISRGIPLVGTFHSKYYDDFYQKTHSRVIARFGTRGIVRFYELCDEVWAVNSATAAVLRDYGFKGEVQVMPNGTNLWYPTEADCARAAAAYHIDRTRTVLLFVGQQNWKKNIRRVLEALKLLENRLDFTMVMVGQGPDQEAIRATVEEMGMAQRFIFTGHVLDRELMMGLYALSKLFIFPSIYDNAPMVVREAAAAGTPSVLVRGSCAAEGTRDGENAFLCDDNPESVADAVLRGVRDDGSVGARARETIPVKWTQVIDQAYARYQALIEKGPKKKLDLNLSRLFEN